MTYMSLMPTLRRIGVITMSLLAIVALCACSGKHRHGDYDDEEDEDEVENTSALQIDDELLDSFDPDAPFEQTGHSRAFRIRPREDMTVSAEAGAFEQDVTIRVTDVPGEMMDRLDRKLEGSGTTMIFAYDLDAGLPPDSVIPGKYTVSIDLDKHGIPEELYPYFTMYRVASDGSLQPLNVQIKGHKATYMTSQNSITLGAIAISAFGVGLITSTVCYVMARTPAYMQTLRRAKDLALWEEWDDAVCLRVPDDFGSFYVCYRFSMTEKASQTSEYVKKKNELIKLEKKLYLKALDEATDWSGNGAHIIGEKERIGLTEEYMSKLSHNQRVQELAQDPIFDTPQSVADIITATKMSNRYCRSAQHMKPLTYEFVVFLTPEDDAMGAEAYCKKIPLINSCMVVNYEQIVLGGNHRYEKDEIWKTMTKLVHEMMHLYQYEYLNSILFKDNCFIEATGALVEPHFTDWLIKTVKLPGMPVTDAFSPDAAKVMGYTQRKYKELLSTPLGKECPDYKGIETVQHERGYMLADLLQHIWEKPPHPSDTLDFDKMTNRYAYQKGILKTTKDIFGIESDLDFTKYYERFCEKFIDEIEERQSEYRKKSNGDGLVMPNVEHDPQHCIMRVDKLGEQCGTTAQPFMVNTFRIIAKGDSLRRYNLFAENSANLQPAQMKFTFFNKSKFTANQMSFNPDYSGAFPEYATAAVITRPACKDMTLNHYYYFNIVALYQPEKTPEVKGTSFDRRGLLVKTRCTPSEELTANDYVTGIQVVMKNNKSGHVQPFIVKAYNWYEEFVAPFSELGISDTTDIDVSLRSRWYYESPQGQRYYSPATDIVNYRRQRDRVQQEVEEDSTLVDTDTEVVADEDTGIGAVIDADFFLEEWGGEIPCPIGDETTFEGNREVKGHLTVRPDGSFSVMTPAFSYKLRAVSDNSYMDYSFPAVYIDGKGQYESGRTWANIINVIIPPQTFQYNMSGVMGDENGYATFRYRMISSEGAILGVTLTDDGKLKSFELRIPDTRLSAAGEGSESGSGQSDEVTRTFRLQGMKELPR